MFFSKLFKKKKKSINLHIINKLSEKLSYLEYEIKYQKVAKRLEKNKSLYMPFISNEPIFTFCMPTYNGEKYLARALESILMQETSYKYKIWIIDDASTDNTVKIAEEYAKKYPDIFQIDVNPTNEKGLTMAPKIFNNIKTKYWMNFDQDDYWLSQDKLQRTIDYFELHPECTLIASNLYVKSSNKLTVAYGGDENKISFNFTDYPQPLGILMQTSSAAYRNVFTEEDLKHINSYIGTDKQFCILGDTFRNVFALSKGYGYYENSIDSVYNWTETGAWSKYNQAQQDFYNLEYFYYSIDFFKEPEYKDHLRYVSNFYLNLVEKNAGMLNPKEYNEYIKIKKGLQNA